MRAHGRAQQRGEVARQRSDQQDARLRGLDILLEMQQRPERRDIGRFLGHRDLAVADRRAVDAVWRAVVREAGAGDQLVDGREVAQDRIVGDAGERLADRAHRHAGKRANGEQHVGMGEIGLVEHHVVGGAAGRSTPSPSQSATRQRKC